MRQLVCGILLLGPKSAPSITTNALLTHERDDDGLGAVVALYVARLARVAARLPARHLLQHQALVRDDDAVVLVVHHLLALLATQHMNHMNMMPLFTNFAAPHVVPPRDLVGRRVGLDGAGEVDVVALLEVLGIHHSSQGKLHARHN